MRTRPNNVAFELVRGCNMACSFCGIHAIPKEKKYMDMNTLCAALFQMKEWDPIRIDFCARGEATLHPEFAEAVHLARTFMPKSWISTTTNGVLLTRELAKELYVAGINVINVDCYGNTFDKYVQRHGGLVPMHVFGESDFNPFNRHSHKLRAMVLFRDIGKHDAEQPQRRLTNVAGNARAKGPLKEPLKKVCVDPFRVLTVWWNGDVPLCCRDYCEEETLFNIEEDNIVREWYHNPKLEEARRRLIKGDRAWGICQRCDWHGGFMKGLIFKNKEYLDE